MAMRGVVERPRGLLLREELVTPEAEARLLHWCDRLETEPVVMHGVESRRRIAHFGVTYDFAARATTPTEPLPDVLADLRDRAALLAEVAPATLEEALVTCYPPGAGIGWHRDAMAFGPVVVGVSLRAAAVMRFQRRAAGGERRVFEQPLAPRSAYVLSGAARATWQHSVPAVREERWSVTFRQVRASRSAVPGTGGGRRRSDMTQAPNDPSRDDADETEEKTGVEIGMTDGEGSTFEPEEDPAPGAPS